METANQRFLPVLHICNPLENGVVTTLSWILSSESGCSDGGVVLFCFFPLDCLDFGAEMRESRGKESESGNSLPKWVGMKMIKEHIEKIRGDQGLVEKGDTDDRKIKG